MISLDINGKKYMADVSPDTPLLWVIREHLRLTGTKFGCGAGLCGACTVHLDGDATRACATIVADAVGKPVVTIEGLSPTGAHPVQRAWLAEQVTQCGYCQPGQIMQAASLLAEDPNPSDEKIMETMKGNLCRCGTYPYIKKAIKKAGTEVKKP